MKKIIKTTLLSIFMIICFAMLWYKVIAVIEYDAVNPDQQDYIGREIVKGDRVLNVCKNTTLWRDNGKWYCISYIQEMDDYGGKTYTAIDTFTIDGKKILNNDNVEIQSNSTLAAKFAYVLSLRQGHGNNTQSVGQQLVWHYWNVLTEKNLNHKEWKEDTNEIINWDHLPSSDKEYYSGKFNTFVEHYNNEYDEQGRRGSSFNFDKPEDREKVIGIKNTDTAATNYANSINSDLSISKGTSNPVAIRNGDYIEFGPIVVNYSGSIDYVTVASDSGMLMELDQNNNWNKNDHYINFYIYEGQTQKSVNAQFLPNGREFYIKFKIDDTTKNINKIKLGIKTKSVDIYKARIVILESGISGEQRVLLAEPSKYNSEKNETLDWDINLTGNLKIIKQDLDMIPGIKFEVRKNGNLILKNIKTGEKPMEYNEATWYANISKDSNWQIDPETGANKYGWTNLFTYDEIKGYLSDSACTYRVYNGSSYLLRNNKFTISKSNENKIILRNVKDNTVLEWDTNDWYQKLASGEWVINSETGANQYGWTSMFTYQECIPYMNNSNYKFGIDANKTVKIFDINRYKTEHTLQEWENQYGWSNVYTAQQLEWVYRRLPGVKFKITQGTDYLVFNLYTKEQKYYNIEEWKKHSQEEWRKENWINEFQTDVNGELQINGLRIGTHEVYEVENPLPGFETNSGADANINIQLGQTVTCKMTNHQIIDLKIKKVDADTKAVLPNVGFKVQNTIIGDNGWIYIDSSGNTEYTDFDHAKVFITDSNGECTIPNVLTGIYAVHETTNPNTYYERNVNKYVKTGIAAYTTTNGIDRKDTIDIEITNQKAYMDLKIIKTDEDDKRIKLKGVKFEITKGNDYVIKNNTTKEINYKNKDEWEKWDEKSKWSNTFTTNDKGEIFINEVKVGDYVATEIYNPNEGYEKYPNTKFTIDVQRGENKLVNVYEKAITNKRAYVNVSGYVWKDEVQSKTSTRDNLYNSSSEKGFNEITVRIKNKDGVELKDRDGKTIAQTTTSELEKYSEIKGGEYGFNQVKISDLEAGAYIEFEYDGLIWQSVNKNLNSNNGSKAIDDKERDVLDKKFDSISFGSKASNGSQTVKFNNGKNTIGYSKTTNYESEVTDSSQCILHANTKDAGYTFNYDYANGKGEIKYINLGLYKKPQADLALAQDLENMQVTINGYNQVYTGKDRIGSNNTFKTGSQNGYDAWNVAAKFKDSNTGTYSRIIYNADAEWTNSKDSKKELQVYFTYRIGIKNESTYLTKINSIVDYYDSNLDVVSVGTGLSTKTNTITGAMEYSTNEDVNGYKKITIKIDRNVNVGEERAFYIQFKVNRATVLKMLNNEETNIVYNVAEINSYTVYKDTKGNTVAAVDQDSVPGNITPGTVNTYEDDTEAAPPVEITGGQRKLQGIAFVDKAEFSGNNKEENINTGKTRNGNGKYDNNEKLLANVEVQLINVNNDIQLSPTKTDGNGVYTFTGFIPGEYEVVFKWGDSTYKVQDYKNTIYTLGTVNSDNKLVKNNVEDLYWYRNASTESDAIDDYAKRVEIDNQVVTVNNKTVDEIEAAYKDNYNGNIINKMSSTTPKMNLMIEKGGNEAISMSQSLTYEVNNIDYGIVERAKQALSMDKRAKLFKITLANGQVLADVNVDENGKISGTTNHVNYLKPSPKNQRNTGKLKAEVDNELIAGATLDIGYEIKFTNESELDYMTEEYYKYGRVPKDTDKYVVKLKPSIVYDYLDNRLSMTSNEDKWEQIDKAELQTQTKKDEISLNKILKTTKVDQIAPGKNASIELNVSKLLSSSDEITFDNKAENVEIKKLKDDKTSNQHTGRRIQKLPKSADSEQVIVTPSTGENRDYKTIIIVSITSLIVLAGGIILIKKKIL